MINRYILKNLKKGDEAEKRERQFKKWKRAWKIKLIEEMNPSWVDLSLNWNFNYNKFRKHK